MVGQIVSILQNPDVQRAISHLRSMKYDVALLFNPGERLAKYRNSIAVIVDGFNGLTLMDVLTYLNTGDNLNTLPAGIGDYIKNLLGENPSDVLNMLIANYDLIVNTLTNASLDIGGLDRLLQRRDSADE